MFLFISFEWFKRAFILYFKDDIEIPVPKYFLQENREAIKDRENIIGKVLQKTQPYDSEKKVATCDGV